MNNIRECRLKAGITQEELALKVGISVALLDAIEKGIKSPTDSLNFKFNAIFGYQNYCGNNTKAPLTVAPVIFEHLMENHQSILSETLMYACSLLTEKYPELTPCEIYENLILKTAKKNLIDKNPYLFCSFDLKSEKE